MPKDKIALLASITLLSCSNPPPASEVHQQEVRTVGVQIGSIHDDMGYIAVDCDQVHRIIIYHAKNGYGEALAVTTIPCG